jgi:hypothetical protein
LIESPDGRTVRAFCFNSLPSTPGESVTISTAPSIQAVALVLSTSPLPLSGLLGFSKASQPHQG